MNTIRFKPGSPVDPLDGLPDEPHPCILIVSMHVILVLGPGEAGNTTDGMIDGVNNRTLYGLHKFGGVDPGNLSGFRENANSHHGGVGAVGAVGAVQKVEGSEYGKM